MCGLPASGKSTKAVELAKEYNANIHSSDEIRKELSGNANNQDINELVFSTLHNRIKEDLKHEKSCIYDATNIHYKRRAAFLRELNKIPCEKICVLMATPFEKCLENNTKREREVPIEVIERMYMNFDVPYYYEGWNDIQIEYINNSRGCYGDAFCWVDNVMEYNQDNKHHALTLGEHCKKAYDYINNSLEYNSVIYNSVILAGLLHDCGKPYCKTFINSKCEVTEQAHYYNHEKVGAYKSLFYNIPYALRVAILIRWHMQLHFIKHNEKAINKYKKLWGEDLYNNLVLLHEADLYAH